MRKTIEYGCLKFRSRCRHDTFHCPHDRLKITDWPIGMGGSALPGVWSAHATPRHCEWRDKGHVNRMCSFAQLSWGAFSTDMYVTTLGNFLLAGGAPAGLWWWSAGEEEAGVLRRTVRVA